MDYLEYQAPWGRMRIGVASGFISRLCGLLGRGHLPMDEGLLITPCSSIHTFGMRFPIDVLALDGTGKVVKHLSCVPPARIVILGRNARMILEMAAGTSGGHDLVGHDLSALVRLVEGAHG